MKKHTYFLLSTIILSGTSWAAREHQVKTGDHVIQILKNNHYPMQTQQQKKHWLAEMMRLNKSKFTWGEIDLIQPGSVLTLPTHPSDKPTIKKSTLAKPTVSIEYDKAIGTLQVEFGSVRITSQQGTNQTIQTHASLYEGDSIISAKNSNAKINMVDNAKFELGANSKLSFERYQYHPKQPTKSITLTRFYRGVMRATTGLIGKFAPKKFDVRTPVISIGIRGTDYVARHCDGDDCGDYTGSSLAVMDGGVATQTSVGSVDVNKGEFIQASISGKLSEVTNIPEGFLDLERDITQIESPLSWWQKVLQRVQEVIQ